MVKSLENSQSKDTQLKMKALSEFNEKERNELAIAQLHAKQEQEKKDKERKDLEEKEKEKEREKEKEKEREKEKLLKLKQEKIDQQTPPSTNSISTTPNPPTTTPSAPKTTISEGIKENVHKCLKGSSIAIELYNKRRNLLSELQSRIKPLLASPNFPVIKRNFFPKINLRVGQISRDRNQIIRIVFLILYSSHYL
jgi:hypothetical protein